MKKFTEQIKKKAAGIGLRDNEKNALRARLLSFMEYHPISEKVTDSTSIGYLSSGFFSTFSWNRLYVRSAAGFFILFAAVGMPAMAERALPGDVLYPVKVQFNEELRSTLTLSPYAKIEWETTRLERRIAEARLLADEGRLTEATELAVAEAVKRHSEAAQQGISQLRLSSDSDEATLAEIAFVSALAVQTEVLSSRSEGSGTTTASTTTGHSVVSLTKAVREARDRAESLQGQAPVSVERLFALIERETTYAAELFASISASASDKEKTDIERRLVDLSRKVAAAKRLKAELDLAVAADTPNGSEAEIAETGTTTTTTTKPVITETLETGTTTASTSVLNVPEVKSENESDESEESELAVKEVESATSSDPVAAALSAASTAATTRSGGERKSTHIATEAEIVAILRGVLTDTRKLISFMTDIDVRRSVTVDRLIPITLTDEERVETVIGLLDNILAIQSTLSDQPLPAELAEAIAADRAKVVRLISQTTLSLEEGDLDRANFTAGEALVLIRKVQDTVVGWDAEADSELGDTESTENVE